MWRDYSSSYVKNNLPSSVSIIIAAFISALLLSLLCSLFYNLWFYDVQSLKIEEGDWQGRFVGAISTDDLTLIENYASVEKVTVNENLSDEQGIVVDVYFANMGNVFTDMPKIAELVGLPAESVSYHYSLLSLYLIRSADDPALRWIFPFYLLITVIACFSLILVIHNAFAVTMSARIHQFGIFSSIGATPRQIRTCLLQEALTLCAITIIVGNVLGIFICMGVIEGINSAMADVVGRLVLPFSYHPLILVLSLLATVLTVWISAWIPARKMGRLTPMEAIRNTNELQLNRRKKSRILSLLFGVEGELAGNALKAQRKSMRTATLSLVFSFLAFSFMMCFFTLLIVNQDMTYFEKYQDVWDVMATVKSMDIDAFTETDTLQELYGVESGVVYQKAAAKRMVTQDEISEELQAIGGLQNASTQYVSAVDGAWLVNAPLVIMDDTSFLAYCEQIGTEPRLDGVIILNQARDAADPNFHDRRSVSYLAENGQTTILRNAGQEEVSVEIPVLAYARQVPVLREEYGTLDFYELVHFVPLSVWKEIKGQFGETEADTYIRILTRDGVTLDELNEIEGEVSGLLSQRYQAEIENRIQAKLDNDKMFRGMMAVIGLFCILLALIGIGNIFTNTFGFVRQRKREFARYMSIGMTPDELKKIFCVEALVIAGRPILITIPLTVIPVVLFINMAYIDSMVFLHEAPFIPILLFVLPIIGFVALAYYIGAKKVLGSSLIDSLRDDTTI
ncbi:MAG: ABC transporter permease [Lachnospiraceae bacterium]|nr:ABC transporter permease [Lachnospiraceae bacterium]